MDSLENKFAEWYSVVVPQPQSGQVTARLQGINNISKRLTKEDLIRCVRLFYKSPAETAFVEVIRKALKAEDKTYASSEDDAELAVIAGAVIYSVASESSNNADALCLGVFCAEVGGLRKTPRIDAVVARCKEYLLDEGARMREGNIVIPKLPSETLAAGIKNLATHYPAGLPAYGPALEDVVLKLANAVGAYAGELSEQIDRIETLRLEESNILYWLIGESTQEGVRYSQLEVKESVVQVALDLAEMTKYLPGPPAARSFMQKMLTASKNSGDSKVAISECVGAIDPAQRKRIATKFAPKDAFGMPILFAIAKADESGGSGWNSAFSAQTSLDAKKKIEAIGLAEQLYSELLMLRAIS